MESILLALAVLTAWALLGLLIWQTLRAPRLSSLGPLPPLRHQADLPPIPEIRIEPFDRRKYNAETARAMREIREREAPAPSALRRMAEEADVERLRREEKRRRQSDDDSQVNAALLMLAMSSGHSAPATPAAAAAISPGGGDFGGGGATGAWSAPEPSAPAPSPSSDSGGGFSGGDSGGGGGGGGGGSD